MIRELLRRVFIGERRAQRIPVIAERRGPQPTRAQACQRLDAAINDFGATIARKRENLK